MKKLITLLLFMGCVCSASATKTIYIKNNCSWPQMRSYQWGASGNVEKYMFIGSTVNVETVNVENDTYYTVELDDEHYTSFILDKNYDSGNEKTNDLLISSVTNGAFYEFKWTHDYNGTKYYDLKQNTVYTYNFTTTTAEGVSLSNIYVWDSNDNELNGSYPGKEYSSEYIYRTYSNIGTINVIFNQGANPAPQTCNMTAEVGDNLYYIGSVASGSNQGEIVKTNGNGFATYCCTNALSIPADIAYCAKDNNNGSARAYNVTNPAAETAMLIKGTANTTYHFAKGGNSSDPSGYTNAFIKGNGNNVTNNGSSPFNYILKGDAFYYANNNPVAANKAYLQLSVATPAASRVLVFDEEESTGITAVSLESNDTNFYNLQGVKVANPAKGLYIHNGKKYVVK